MANPALIFFFLFFYDLFFIYIFFFILFFILLQQFAHSTCDKLFTVGVFSAPLPKSGKPLGQKAFPIAGIGFPAQPPEQKLSNYFQWMNIFRPFIFKKNTKTSPFSAQTLQNFFKTLHCLLKNSENHMLF